MKFLKKHFLMKTICPHCNQIYDVEENWIGIELQCSVCQQHFLAENAEHLASSPCETAQSNIMQQEKYVVDKSGDLWHKMIRWFKEKCRKQVEVDTFCPHCHQKYELPKRLLNTQVTCTNCDQNFFVEKCLLCPSCQNICPTSDEICKFCGTNIALFEMDQHKSTLKEKDDENDCYEEEVIIEESVATKGGIETYCSHCYQKYELPKRLLNTQVTCTNCNQNFLVEKWLSCPVCQNLNHPLTAICKNCRTNIRLFEMDQHKSALSEEEQYTPALWKNCLFVPLSVILLILAPYFAISNFSFWAILVWVKHVIVYSIILLLLLGIHILPFIWIIIARKLNPHWAFKVIYPLYKVFLGVQCFFVALSVGGCFNLLDTFTILGVIVTEIFSIISCTVQVFLFSRCFPYKTPPGAFTKNIVCGLIVGFILLIVAFILFFLEMISKF